MAKAQTTEKAFNFALSTVLRKKHPLWGDNISAEQTQVIQGMAGRTPDLLLSLSGWSPVVIETEFMPAATVEIDAKSRLRNVLSDTSNPIEHSIAVRIPAALKSVKQSELEKAIEDANFSYCIHSAVDGEKDDRWPENGWIEGGIDDLVNCIESVTLTESLVSRSTDILESAVRGGAYELRDAPESVQRTLANQLRQAPGEQTNRMAVAIIANAIVFHSRIEGREGVPPLESLVLNFEFRKTAVIDCWQSIYTDINYWPIFKIATELLINISIVHANRILKHLRRMSDALTELGVIGLNDLSGRMFQKLIADRKFLATFYTLPVSATLLAELAIPRLNTDWADAKSVKSLKVADLACGTGTLIGALYHSILTRYRRTGNDDSEIHSAMIENSIYACDIMPAATHLTASTLSNLHPRKTYGTTKIVTMPYGQDEHKVPYIGSLELIKDVRVRSLLSLGRQQIFGRLESEMDENFDVLGQSTDLMMDVEADHDVDVDPESLDIVIMNPPFTRPTNHERADVPVPSFAGFNTSEDEQKAMSARLKWLRKELEQPAGHGNAGLASNFIDLAHVKLKPGGVLALVLPATFVEGESWKNSRNLLVNRYRDITIVSITSAGRTEPAYSADTGIAEVMVVATKKTGSEISAESASDTFQFANLRNRPASHVEAMEVAKAISQSDRCVGDGRIKIGNSDDSGTYIIAGQFYGGCAGLTHPSLARIMTSLWEGILIVPKTGEHVNILVTTLDNLGNRGLLHRDLTGTLPRGPFDKVPLRSETVPTYPCLWRHDSERERSLIVLPDSELLVRHGHETKSADIWNSTSSRLHLTLDFRLSSQSLAACLTPEKTLGGTAWPNFCVEDPRTERAIVLWLNSTLGLMTYWWIGTKQQKGRTRLTISTLESLVALDTRQFDDSMFDKVNEIFERFESVEFLPANECFRDENRKALDEALLIELLDIPRSIVDEFDFIRSQWCAEPRVHGGKSTRPKSEQ